MALSRRLVKSRPSQVLSSRVRCSPEPRRPVARAAGRSHDVHGADLEVALGHGPLEGVQAPVAVVGGGRFPASELVGDELLDVLAAEFAGEDRVAVGWQ
jgi:hypothetical protein